MTLRTLAVASMIVLGALAGCLESTPAPTTPTSPANPPAPARNDTSRDGIELHAGAADYSIRPGDSTRFTFLAKNAGAAAIVPGGPCDSPWTFLVLSPQGDEIVTSPPRVRCLAATFPEPFPTGATKSANFTWNGTLWDGARYVSAPEGRYAVEARFRGNRGDAAFEAPVDVSIVVAARGATSPPYGSAGGAPSHGTLVRPPHEETTTPTLTLTGDADASGFARPGNVTVRFTAKNLGKDATVHGACSSPWEITLVNEKGEKLQLEEPMMRCLAISNDPWPAGAMRETNVTWDGTYWVDGEARDAPPGAYVLTAAFTAARGDASDSAKVSVKVNLLERMA